MNKFEFFNAVYVIVKDIPKGKVMSYGQIAALLGSKYYARRVGQAMFNCPSNQCIPWYRVIKSNGEMANASIAVKQKEKLMAEGVTFKSETKIDCSCFIQIL